MDLKGNKQKLVQSSVKYVATRRRGYRNRTVQINHKGRGRAPLSAITGWLVGFVCGWVWNFFGIII